MAETEKQTEFSGRYARLSDWANEPTVKDMKETLNAASTSQKVQIGKITNWLNHLNVEGDAKPKPRKGRSQVQPKLIRKQAEWRYSALTEPFLSAQQLFTVRPVSWEDTAAAQQNQLVLNWQFRTKVNKVRFIDEYVRTAVDEGTVIVRVSWARESVIEMVDAPVYAYYPVSDPNWLAQLQQAMQLKQENPAQFAQLPEEMQESVNYTLEQNMPLQAVQTGTQETKQEKVTRNEPVIEIVNTANVYIDPSCQGVFEDARFVIYSFETSYAELKADGRYKNLDTVNFEGRSILAEPDHVTTTPDDFTFKDKARKRIVAYEYWGWYDIKGDGVLVPIVSTWVGDIMIRLEENPFPDGKIPFVVVPYLPVKRSVYGEPDGSLLEDNQRIAGAVTRGMIDIMARSANGQKGMRKDMLDVVNKRKFDNGEDYEFNMTVDPRQGIVEHVYPEIPNSALTMVQLMNQEAESLTGVKAFSGGLSGDSYGPTATGTRGVLDAASKRETAILRRLAKGMAEIGQKIVMMNGEFMSEEEQVRLTNDQFVPVRRDDLQGNFDLEVAITTAEEDNAKSEQLAFMLQTMASAMPSDFSQMILADIARLRNMPALAHKIQNFKPQPDPVQQQLQQLELQKAELELQQVQQKIATDKAQEQYYYARARDTGNAADQKTLDYVEQETGTKHAREMEKQSAQAEANQNLEVTKGLLNRKPAGPGKGEGAAPTGPDMNHIQQAIGFNQLSKAMSP